MFGMLFKIVAKPGKKAAVVEFLRWDATVAKVAEPGTRRFDVWNVPGESDALYVYEGYTDAAAFEKHKANKPYQRYVSYVEPELLESNHKIDVFGLTESLVSDEDFMWEDNAERASTSNWTPEMSRLSFTSFPPDTKARDGFSDYAELRRLTAGKNSSVAHVEFPPSVRTHWHQHEGDQLLWFIEGHGIVALRDGRAIVCQAGDIVRVRAHSSHWHGASAEHSAVHIAITEGATTWEEPVIDAH